MTGESSDTTADFALLEAGTDPFAVSPWWLPASWPFRLIGADGL